MKHVTVYHEPGRFAGWPANNGVWSWRNEIVVKASVKLPKSEHETQHHKDRAVCLRTTDGGATFETDARTWDSGYPRMVQRPDGRLITIYYCTTEARPEQHIAVTVWNPDSVSNHL